MGASVILYITLFMAASWLQLWGYKLIDGNTGPYNAICSCYPMINLLISYLFFGQKNVNWWYVLPGMLLIMTGVTVLAVAPPVVSSNGTDTPVNGAPTAGGNMAGQTDDTNKP
jgi:drug/metabolite transporter (DMT)-like permease